MHLDLLFSFGYDVIKPIMMFSISKVLTIFGI